RRAAPGRKPIRRSLLGVAAVLGLLTTAVPAHAVATIAADTTRAPLTDAAAAGVGPTLVAGGLSRTQLRFRVAGLSVKPARALLRLRITDPTLESLQVRAVPAFAEDAATPAILIPSRFAIARGSGATAGAWAQFDVTRAVAGNGDVNLQVSGPLFDPASFSSREGPDAPQLLVTPDDGAAARLAGLLDIGTADSFDAGARDDRGHPLDGLEVIEAPPGRGVPARFIGVHHSLVGGVFVTQLATSDDLRHWKHRGTLDTRASQPSIAAVPGGGFVLAVERDTPDAQYISTSNIVVRHYASWAALAAGTFDAEANLPRTVAATAEGTPALRVLSWGGTPAASQIEITFHYLKDIQLDRQASGVLTNFNPATWTPQVTPLVNELFVALGTRGNLGDRADVLFEGRRFAVLEAQSVRGDFATWRWYLYDRDRNEARLLGLHAPAGSSAFGNPTVRAFTDAQGVTTLFVSGYAFGEGAAFGEAGQFIALRRLGGLV
ncbi:MAG TPA: hypothetical protein VGV90_01520, partial [Solirubrobacteraceae bacterium]|nr:hypothetical protein [Solirubrobacteraceae bacterium]